MHPEAAPFPVAVPVVVAVSSLLAGCSTTTPESPVPSRSPSQPTVPTESPDRRLPAPDVAAAAPAVVAWWDEQRRTAWTEGDPARLQALYAPGSRAGEVDVDNLTAYVEAGVRTRDWQTQRQAVRQVARGDQVLTAVVSTRQQGTTVALGDDPLADDDLEAARRLPASPARRVQVSLRWSESVGWRVAEVRPVSRPRPRGPRGAPARPRGGRS